VAPASDATVVTVLDNGPGRAPAPDLDDRHLGLPMGAAGADGAGGCVTRDEVTAQAGDHQAICVALRQLEYVVAVMDEVSFA
jgi:hypothetical protein